MREQNMRETKLLRAVLRGALGIPIGLAIGYLMTILTSLFFAQGHYAPCVPQLTAAMGSEIRAVLVQAALCALLGASFSASSVVWEIDHWGLMAQTGVYFFINAAVMLPTAYALYWMEHSAAGFIRYFSIFLLVFALIWIVEYLAAKYMVGRMNENLRHRKNNGT